MVQKLIELITNPVFFSAGASWFTAQVLKTVITIIKNRGFSPEALVASGGMPSTHTAMVTGLTVSAFLTYGPGGFEFPMAFFFAMVVLSVRRWSINAQECIHSTRSTRKK
jgi:acid phosphatase family membrane protein YuiD